MLKTVAVALALLIPAPALAGDIYLVRPSESEFIKYEIALKQFFSTPILAKNAGKYLRTSNADRRKDGQVACSMLTAYSTEDYLARSFERQQELYRNNPKKLGDESAYSIGVTAAAIDTMCTEHRAELSKFFANLKQTAAGTSSRNR